MALAVSAGYWLAVKRSVRYGIEPVVAESFIFWLVVGGFIGARLYHVWSSFDYYKIHPIEIFQVWHGGLSIYGALLGGLTALFLVRKFLIHHSSFLRFLDWLTPSLLVGQVIGRFGNLFNYELYGYPTQVPWKMFVPKQFRVAPYIVDNFFHPLFLYELLGNIIIFLILMKFVSPRALPGESSVNNPVVSADQSISYIPSGALFFYYLLLYNILRFFLEFLRIDSPYFGGFRQNALVSLVLVLGAAGAILFLKKQKAS